MFVLICVDIIVNTNVILAVTDIMACFLFHCSTTKYNVITFVPKFLFDQFRRYSNLFFLIMALLEVHTLH